MEPGYDGGNLRQPVWRLEQGDLSCPDTLEERQGSVGILFCRRRRKYPLHHYAGVDDRFQGRPALRALAISASETGCCFRRKSSNASIAAALRFSRCFSATACCMRRAMTALLFSFANASWKASLTSSGTLKLTVAMRPPLLKSSTKSLARLQPLPEMVPPALRQGLDARRPAQQVRITFAFPL